MSTWLLHPLPSFARLHPTTTYLHTTTHTLHPTSLHLCTSSTSQVCFISVLVVLTSCRFVPWFNFNIFISLDLFKRFVVSILCILSALYIQSLFSMDNVCSHKRRILGSQRVALVASLFSLPFICITDLFSHSQLEFKVLR